MSYDFAGKAADLGETADDRSCPDCPGPIEAALRDAAAWAFEVAARRADEYPGMGLLASDLRARAKAIREGE